MSDVYYSLKGKYMIIKKYEQRLSKVESICNSLDSERMDILYKAYEKAVNKNNKEKSAYIARKIRNILLEESDKEYALDRIIPESPEGTNLNDWIVWLRKIGESKNNEWGKYRQQLRDLPEQEGFPFEINFPKSPKEN